MSSRKPMHLNYNHLHYFHVAAVEGSVGGAAHYLGVTQPTISEQLRTLERSLGVVLFERQSSGLRLTDAGRITFKHTTVMFGAGERLAEELDHGSDEAPSLLRVGVCSSVSKASTTDLLAPLLEIDGCRPNIRVGEYVELARELRGSRLDLVLYETEPPKSERRGFDVALVERTTLVVVTSPDLDPSADWRELTLLQYRVGSQLRWDVDAFLKARGLHPKVAAEADDARFLVDAVTRGRYVAIVPRALVRDALARGRNVRALDTFESQHVGIYALYQTGAGLARGAVDRLVEHANARNRAAG